MRESQMGAESRVPEKKSPLLRRLAMILGITAGFGGGLVAGEMHRDALNERGAQHLKILNELPIIEKYKVGAKKLADEVRKGTTEEEKAKAKKVLLSASGWYGSPEAIPIVEDLTVIFGEDELNTLIQGLAERKAKDGK